MQKKLLVNIKYAKKSWPNQVLPCFQNILTSNDVNFRFYLKTAGAAVQHALRAYIQYRDWQLLQSQSLDPREYGSAFTGTFEPVGAAEPIAPSTILQFISCNCQLTSDENGCGNNRCTCKRYGMKCIPACGNCHGQSIKFARSIIWDH